MSLPPPKPARAVQYSGRFPLQQRPPLPTPPVRSNPPSRVQSQTPIYGNTTTGSMQSLSSMASSTLSTGGPREKPKSLKNA